MELVKSNPMVERHKNAILSLRKNIEDNKAFLSLMGVSDSVIEEIENEAEKWFKSGKEHEDVHHFISSDRVEYLLARQFGLYKGNYLYSEVYNLVYCHYSIRFHINKMIVAE